MATSSKVEGVDYVLDPFKFTATGKRARRRATDAELASLWAACERSWNGSLEARGLPPLSLRDRIRAGGDDGFALKFQSALLTEIETREAKPKRKPRAVKASAPKPAPKPIIPKRRERVGVGCEEPVTPRQWAAIACAALAALGEPAPMSKDEASDLNARLMAIA